MNKIMPIEKGLASKIYLLAYPEPKSGYEIANEIYGHDHHRVRTIIKELAEEGYFERVEKDEWKYPKWLSSVEPLFNRIKKIKSEEGITFTAVENKIIFHLLDFCTFREYIETRVPRNLKDSSINATDFILDNLEFILILTAKMKTIHSDRMPINDERSIVGHMEFFKNGWREPIQKIWKDDFYSIFKAYIFFMSVIIPDEFIEKTKAMSSFGEKYYSIEPLFKTFEDLTKNIMREKVEINGKGMQKITFTLTDKYGSLFGISFGAE